MTESINKHVPTKNYILEQVGEIENKFLKSLREVNHRLGEEIRFAGLLEERKIVEEIYFKSNVKCLKGREAALFLDRIEVYEENKPSMEDLQNLLN